MVNNLLNRIIYIMFDKTNFSLFIKCTYFIIIEIRWNRLRNTYAWRCALNKSEQEFFFFFLFSTQNIIKWFDEIPAKHTFNTLYTLYNTYIKCHKKYSIRSSLLRRVLTPLIHIIYHIGRWSRAIVFFFSTFFYAITHARDNVDERSCIW